MIQAIHKCPRLNCGFRFPVYDEAEKNYPCPKCGTQTIRIVNPYPQILPDKSSVSSNEPVIEVILDNIRSTYNVGSIFRTADGAGISKLYLCGITPTPDNPGVAKTALSAEFAVDWSQHWNAIELADNLITQGRKLWAIESNQGAVSLFDITNELPNSPVVLVIGNEVTGIDPDLLTRCEKSFWIPMKGTKRSLNVAIAFGVAAYTVRFSIKNPKFA